MRLLLLILFSFATTLHADTKIKTQIFDIDLGSGKEEPLIYLTSGQVVHISSSRKVSLDSIREIFRNKTWIEIEINDAREIIGFTEVTAPVSPSILSNKSFSTLDSEFTPSILKDVDQAKKFFYEARPDHKKESQCYNRAHVWAYEWRTKNNIYSSKVWLFFTRKYIREKQFEWWFHVAPMVHVITDGEVKERVMDMKYARGPLKLKQWTDIFMRDNADCPVVETYNDHANYPESGSCFVMKSSMYYYQPVDLEQRDLMGALKTRWLEPEVKHAYDEAFGVMLGEQQ